MSVYTSGLIIRRYFLAETSYYISQFGYNVLYMRKNNELFWENTVFLYEIKIENINEDLKIFFTTKLLFMCSVVIPCTDLKWGCCNRMGLNFD